jgi:DNA-binding NarL/FixJ family response regulator
MAPTMTTLLIADDHPLFREALRGAVQRVIPGVQLFEADSVEALYQLADQHTDADLVLMDLNMPGAQGFNALVHMRALHPQLPVVVVSAREEPTVMRRALDHGAFGFIPKSADSDTIGHALGTILDGETWAPPEAHNVPPTGREEREIGQRLRELTPQQFRVLQMLGAGRLNKQIAYDLNVSEATIKAHVTAILRKLGVTNRTQAVLMAGKLAIDDEQIVLPPEED